MSRIVYLAFPAGGITGGQKMILRHVETLRDLGFDAVLWHSPQNPRQAGIPHRAPIKVGTPFRPDDILVLPDDAPNALRTAATLAQPLVVFCQNQFGLAGIGTPALAAYPPDREVRMLTVGPTAAASIQRIFPDLPVAIVPCFADERVFRPAGAAAHRAAYAPRKRPQEAVAIRNLLPRLHPRHAGLPFHAVENVSEPEVAEAFAGSALFLSLSRLEAVGITPLEAMASGCVCAGFTGIGGRDFASPENGFWVEEDDLFAATDALAAAADLVLTGGPPLARMRDAGRATAEQWSYGRFRERLEAVWSEFAPAARLRDGPLD
ncbi:glycosyltransferase [Phenylobacterium sp.]|jgi:glycosyltransferase involved in cell wall biosynthesis|uniref:glycosyltransferase n=1 Tax=Phenylobacterium sp. TaxID=1871053 RepID=UPI002F920CF0